MRNETWKHGHNYPFTVAALRLGPSALLERWHCMIFQILPIVSSFTSLGWCLTWTLMPYCFRLGWCTIWQDVGCDFLSATKGMADGAYKSSGLLPPFEVNLDQWKWGDGREPRSMTCFIFFDSCGRFLLANTIGEDPHAEWTCLLSKLPPLFGAAVVVVSEVSNSLHHVVSPLSMPLVSPVFPYPHGPGLASPQWSITTIIFSPGSAL